MYTFKTNINEKEYNKFISKFSYSNFMQEKSWANVKNNFDNILCGVYDDKKLVAACSILVRHISKGISMFYIPRGYLIDFKNTKTLKFMTDNIKGLAKKYKVYVAKIDPNFCVSEKLFKNQNTKFHIYSNSFEEKHNNFMWLIIIPGLFAGAAAFFAAKRNNIADYFVILHAEH